MLAFHYSQGENLDKSRGVFDKKPERRRCGHRRQSEALKLLISKD